MMGTVQFVRDHLFYIASSVPVHGLDLGVRSDKNQRNFENFAQNFSPLGRIRTLLSPELEIFLGSGQL